MEQWIKDNLQQIKASLEWYYKNSDRKPGVQLQDEHDTYIWGSNAVNELLERLPSPAPEQPQDADFDTALEAELKRHEWGVFGKPLFIDGARWAQKQLKATSSGIPWIPYEFYVKGRQLPEDFLLKFDTGEIRRYMEDDLPAALITHYALFPTDESSTAPSQGREVEFAEWLNDNFVSIEKGDWVEYSPIEYDKKRKYSIQELYTLFIKQTKKS